MAQGIPVIGPQTVVYDGMPYSIHWCKCTLDGQRIVVRKVTPNKKGDFATDTQGTGVVQQNNAGNWSTEVTFEIHYESAYEYQRSHRYWMRSSGTFFMSISPPGKPSITFECQYTAINQDNQDVGDDPIYKTWGLQTKGSPKDNGQPAY